jgi:UDP-N-acetylglucosamine--N-acetylmuramyl-(pentapeptide) pyrophosphoryl-undecaprenol N-acetylglucosamine transferase
MRGPAVKPIVIAAGGTGGHFFPAEALAAELVHRGHRVALMTDARAAARLPESFAGREVFVLRGAGIAGRGVRRGASAVARLAVGTLQARAILRRLEPAVVVGFGGYPTFAPVAATRLMRDPPPIVLHEQNAVLGRANRLLARRATALALSFADTARIPQGVTTTVTGNPVRPSFTGSLPGETGDGAIHLVVLGGSLGARVFSDAVPAALAKLPAAMRARLRITQQCRPEDLDRVGQAYAQSGIPADLSSFFTDIPARLAQASLVIARAGASTVAELAIAGRAAVLVPLPGAIDDHQTANARVLEQAGAAWVIAQRDIAILPHRLASLLAMPDVLAKAGLAARSLARPDAAARLADLVLQHARVSA